jgi:hypothetical protein
MPSKKSKAVPFNTADLANITKANPYLQRLLDDADLRDNVSAAIESGKSAYDRLANGKAPAKAVLQDKKLQRDLRQTYESARVAFESLQDAPKHPRGRSGSGLGRKLLLVVIGAAAALAGSEKLRSKVLDTLFGAEEEFQYTPPAATTTDAAPAAPVTAA